MTTAQYMQISIELWGILLCIIAVVCISFTRNMDKRGADKLDGVLICNSLMLLNDVLAIYFRGDPFTFGYYMVRIANFWCFAFSFVISSLTSRYIVHIIKKRTGKDASFPLYGEYAVTSVGIVLLILSRFFGFIYAFDESNRYYRLPFYWIPALFGIVGVEIMLLMVIKYYKYLKKWEKYSILTYLLLPHIAMVVQIFSYGISYSFLALTVSSIVIFIEYEMEYASYMVQAERQLSETRMQLLAHQIQPHFIFNSLTAIRYLCRDNKVDTAAFAFVIGYIFIVINCNDSNFFVA